MATIDVDIENPISALAAVLEAIEVHDVDYFLVRVRIEARVQIRARFGRGLAWGGKGRGGLDKESLGAGPAEGLSLLTRSGSDSSPIVCFQ